MAATDITGTIVAQKEVPNEFQSALKCTVYDIDVTNSDFSGIETQYAHDLIDVPVGEALDHVLVAVYTSFAGTNATVMFYINGESCTGDIPIADLAAGDIVRLDPNDIDGVAGLAGYAKSAVVPIGWDVNTADLTAGRAIFYVFTVDVAELLANG